MDIINHILWSYRADDAFAVAYAWFNVAEAVAWFAIAAYVLMRFRRFRRTPLELAYAGLFVLFGLSDLRESYVVQPWLILAKGGVLVGLLAVRRHLVRCHYPGHRF